MADNNFKQLDPEDSNFVPEIVRNDQGELVDANTGKKFIKPFKQKEYKPLNEYEG